MTSPVPRPGSGPMRVVLGRFRLEAPLPYDLPRASAWLGRDTILGRPVHVYTIEAEDDNAAVLEGAGRSALVRPSGAFQRVLRAEAEGDTAVIVCEPVTGTDAKQLAPFSEPGARWLVVQLAEALQAARARGVSHGMLRPTCVFVTSDGAVTLSGLGWESALCQLPTGTAQDRAARDARGLLEIYCYALLGQPFHERRSDFDPYPTTQPYLPGEVLWDRFPPELRTLAHATLTGQDTAAVSPAEVLQAMTGPAVADDGPQEGVWSSTIAIGAPDPRDHADAGPAAVAAEQVSAEVPAEGEAAAEQVSAEVPAEGEAHQAGTAAEREAGPKVPVDAPVEQEADPQEELAASAERAAGSSESAAASIGQTPPGPAPAPAEPVEPVEPGAPPADRPAAGDSAAAAAASPAVATVLTPAAATSFGDRTEEIPRFIEPEPEPSVASATSPPAAAPPPAAPRKPSEPDQPSEPGQSGQSAERPEPAQPAAAHVSASPPAVPVRPDLAMQAAAAAARLKDITEEIPAVPAGPVLPAGPVGVPAVPSPAAFALSSEDQPPPHLDQVLPPAEAAQPPQAPPQPATAETVDPRERRGRWWVVDSSITEIFPTRDE